MDNITYKSSSIQKLNVDYQLILVYRFALLMVLFSISRLGFYYFNLGHFSDITFLRLMRIMFGGLKFDISAILYVNVLYILFYLLPLPFRNHKIYQTILKWIFYITNGIALAANAADFFYFEFILKRSTADVFMFAVEGNKFALFQLFLVDYWQGFLFWGFQMAILVFGYNKLKIKKLELPKRTLFYLSGILWLLISVYFTIVGMRGGFTGTTRPISLGNAAVYTQRPLEMAIVLNTPFAIARTLNKAPLKEKQFFSKEELDSIYNPVYKVDTCKGFKPLNVVVIILESFAKEYIGALNRNLDNGKYLGYTPFLDSLIGIGKSFNHSFANGRKSIDAMPSILASIPSVGSPYVLSTYASNEINGIATLLKAKGYQSAFFHGAPNGSMGFDSFAKLVGYDKYFGMTEYGNDDDFDGTWGIWDEEFMLFMEKELNKMKPPFLATLFTASSHHPFRVPEKYIGKFKAGTIPFHIPIQYSDLALRNFFAAASKEPWFKNTLFVITADHSNQAYHPEYKTSIGDFSVPLIFYNPSDNELKGMDSTVVQQTDILPTVLQYLNYDRNYISFGNNALNKSADNYAVNYNNFTYQIINGNYVLQFVDDKTIGLYNYISDPLINHNLMDKMPELKAEMETKLKAFIQQYNYRLIHNELTVKK